MFHRSIFTVGREVVENTNDEHLKEEIGFILKGAEKVGFENHHYYYGIMERVVQECYSNKDDEESILEKKKLIGIIKGE